MWQGFLIGVLSGIVATLLADNAYLRFHVEKALRKLLRKSLVSVSLTSFDNFCDGGIFLIHCIELKNIMWLTTKIPRIYFLSRGTFPYEAHAYKPFIYFRSHALSASRKDSTPAQLVQEYSNNIAPYSPDNPSLSVDITRALGIRVVVIVEAIPWSMTSEGIALNHQKIVGELHAAVANPMPIVSPGGWWDMSIISEDFGHIDRLHISIPADLKEREPLGDSITVLQMRERPPCLVDISYSGYTWPLRFNVNDCEISIKRKSLHLPIETQIQVKKPKKKPTISKREIKRFKRVMTRTIRIQ